MISRQPATVNGAGIGGKRHFMAKLFIDDELIINTPEQLSTVLNDLMPSIEAFWPDDNQTPQFYFEWGNEPADHVSIGRYDENDTLVLLGHRPKSLVKAWELPYLCPFN